MVSLYEHLGRRRTVRREGFGKSVRRALCPLLLLAVGVAVATATPTATASPPEPVSGTFAAPPPQPTSIREAGRNCIARIDDEFTLAGALQGRLALDFTIVFHGPCAEFPGLPANFRAPATFTGTAQVDGARREGAFEGRFNGRIDERGQARGRLVARHGSGELSGLHGILDLQGIPGVGGTYSGALHLHP